MGVSQNRDAAKIEYDFPHFPSSDTPMIRMIISDPPKKKHQEIHGAKLLAGQFRTLSQS